MKAAQRKELETNYLADQLGQLMQGQNPHLAVWVAIVAVGALVTLAYWAVPRQARDRMTLAWQSLWEPEESAFPFIQDAAWPYETAQKMETITEQQRGTPSETPARFILAQAEQALALRRINDSAKAGAHLHRAEELYRQVLAEGNQSAELRVRAHLGLAQVAETCFWLEKERLQPQERQRRWAQVLTAYEKALQLGRRELQIAAGESHPLLQEIEAHLQRLGGPQASELVFFPAPAAAPSGRDATVVPPQAPPHPGAKPN
ncbi:hypothetical protein HRbin36_00970 [bacterium HR36]|nr:hypothetical protein HRbin36_00970 [bacterium HR36]